MGVTDRKTRLRLADAQSKPAPTRSIRPLNAVDGDDCRQNRDRKRGGKRAGRDRERTQQIARPNHGSVCDQWVNLYLALLYEQITATTRSEQEDVEV
uniref:Uncharacterized protein n=1 Tax=Setaria digitata TaxID=48799 RepID=A0A915Q6Y2_9BILA